MAVTKIRGNTQIKDDTLTNDEINSAADIETSKLEDGAEFLRSDSAVAWGVDQDAGGYKLTNLADGTSSGDAVTYDQISGAFTDEKIKVSSNDTTADYLLAKLIGTANKIMATEVGDGGDEDLQLDIGADVFDKTADDLDDIPDGTTYKLVTAAEKTDLGTLTDGSDADSLHNHADSIHDNVAGEIVAIADKASPVSADHLLIEDSEDSNNKKDVTVGSLPLGGDLGGTLSTATVDDGADGTAIHDDTSGEINAITAKTALVGADEFLIEDSEDSNSKKKAALSDINDIVIFGSHFQSVNTDGQADNDTGVYATTQTLTTGTIPAGDYYIGWYFEAFSDDNSSGYFDAYIQLDGTTTIGAMYEEVADESNWMPISGFYIATFGSATTHTVTMNYRNDNNGTASIRRRRIVIWRVS